MQMDHWLNARQDYVVMEVSSSWESPVVSWPAVRILMIMPKLYNLHIRAIDFVLAYPYTDVKTPIYLLAPTGVDINTNGEDLVLILRKNLYRLKDAGRTLWEHLSEGLEKLGFKQCNSDSMCMEKRRGDEGDTIEEYLRVKVDHNGDGSFR
eukprot:6171144-Ditylum_brightwellii.AAC.1